MQRLSRTARRTALGATVGVVVVGAAAGIAGFANAAPTTSPSAPTTGASAPAQPGPRGHDGRGPGARGGDQLASELAAKLNLDKDKVATALREVRDANRPTTKPTAPPTTSPTTPPTKPDPAARDAELAKALAPKLGVAEDKIKTALDEIRAAHEADRAKALDDKLAAAVKAGTLTQAEADAVKKAVDKGVINVGPR